MITLELARRLHDLGINQGTRFITWDLESGKQEVGGLMIVQWIEPNLSQLLAEIEREGYWWDLNHRLIDGKTKKYKMWIAEKHNNAIPDKSFVNDTSEAAAGLALIWILERKGGIGE